MATQYIKFKRSSVPGKRPFNSQMELGELALNTNDGRIFTKKETVGIGTTITLLNVWTENVGGGAYYNDGFVGIGTTNPTSKLHVVGDGRFTDVVTATTFVGTLSGFASTAGIATYATNAGIATYATNAGIATYATNAGIATYATNAGVSTYATNTGVSTSVIGGIASVTQLQVTGVSTFTNGPVLIGGGTSTGTAGQVLQVAGINSSAYIGGNIGIGTTNPTSKLHVIGDGRFTGVITATTFVGNLTGTASTAGIATYATNAGVSTSVIGGIASVTQLTVSGISTFNNNVHIPSSSVGIGTTNPLQRLQIGTANTLGINTTGTVFVVTSNAYVGIGTTNPTSRLTVQGDVLVSGVITSTDYNSTSDIKLKENIQPIENPIDKVLQINGVSFD